MSVLEFYGLAPAEGTFGIEVEVEGVKLPVVDNNVWTTTHDGSLRGESAEYIFKKPLVFEKVELALNSLKNSFQKNGSQLNFSYRTSVHVHVNVQQFDRVQLGNLIYLYMLFEEPLIRFCGKSRVGNRFCLRIRDAEAFLPYVTHAFIERELPVLDQNEVRYLGMNLGALNKFGSVEFRSMRGTMDVDVLMKWVGMLNKMRTFALKEGMTPALIADYPNIFSAVFGDLGKDLEYPGMDMDMRASFSRTLEFPFDIEWVKKKRNE